MAIFTVLDSAGLYDALANATGGDTIELAGGDYGSLYLNANSGFDITYDAPVTITSDDPQVQASFSGLDLRGAENVTFDNVTFDYTYESGHVSWQQPFYIESSTNITVRNSLFNGDTPFDLSAADNELGFATGLYIIGSKGIVTEGNEFTTWLRGLVVLQSEDIEVTGNDVHSIRSDGMNFYEVKSVLIEDNYIHDFKTAPGSNDHVDLIQFWSSGATIPSADITIRGNTLDIGDGAWAQSIFMRNEVVDLGLAGPEMHYQNILIEDNVILNGHSHGIAVGATDGLTIRSNSVLSIETSDDRYYSAPVISISPDSTSVNIQQNATSAIYGYDNQTDWSLSNNAYIQNANPDAPGYYADLFFESSMEGRDSAWSYVVAPGSMIDNLSAGSSRLLLDTTPDTVTPHFDVTSSADTPQTLVFDATHTYGPAGQIVSDGATFIWNFGDGTTATGRVVEHSYDTAANYDVTLKVLLDGQDITTAATAYTEVGIAGSDILTFNAADGQFYIQGYGTEAAIDDPDAVSAAAKGENAVDLGGIGTKIEIPQEAISRFFGSDGFKMEMTLQADQPGTSWGEIARIHSSIVVSVQGNGDLKIQMFPDSGEWIELTSQGISVNDGAEHDISIVFDGASDSLQILIDGTVAASQTVSGSMPSMGSWGLTFGNPWEGQNFDGKLSAFDLDATSADYYPVFEGVLEGPGDGGGHDEGALPVLDDFVTDFAQLKGNQLRDDAYVDVVQTAEVAMRDESYVEVVENDYTIHLDGEKDHVNIGKLTQFAASDQLSFSITYNKSNLNSEEQRLAWKSNDVGLSVEGDSLKVYVAQEDTRFRKAIEIDGLGLDDTETHQVVVMVDAVTDHLQVILDGALVLDMVQDFDIVLSSNEFNRSWKIGGGRTDTLDGEISDFRIDASAEFLPESLLVQDDASLMG